ncbi:hypothetical protein Pan216_57730 [Planctomycetes bacterium Pan216]|uniref:Methyltransferase type 11 domain-containing protein n=1 Tax=Kolteria novifilia TaxID=2527975 RepID=A0A518BD23_9BACT|nr:hypothetical protein Pan216_57730 [Planctomycetes bacterium Pan216]
MDVSLYEEMWRTEETHWWFLGRRRIVTSLIKRYANIDGSGPKRICELGCGCGANLAAWAIAHDVHGMDASPVALEFARRRLGERVREGRLPDKIPFAPESFDIVVMTDVLEHVEHDAASTRSALNLLVPGGILLCTVPAYQWLYSPRDEQHHHYRRYARNQFRQLFADLDVELELFSYYNSLLFPPAAMIRLKERWFGVSRGKGDLSIPPRPVNRMLATIFSFESRLLPRMTMPAGLSLIAVARRRERGAAVQAI